MCFVCFFAERIALNQSTRTYNLFNVPNLICIDHNFIILIAKHVKFFK